MSSLILNIIVGFAIGVEGSRREWSYLRIGAIAIVAGIVLGFLTALYSQADEQKALQNLKQSTLHLSSGSGFVLKTSSGKSYLVTNWHVCQDMEHMGLMTGSNEQGVKVQGRIVRVSPEKDLCASLIKMPYPALKLSTHLKVGDAVCTRGYPNGILTESCGVVQGRVVWDARFPIEQVGECPRFFKKARDINGMLVGCIAHFTSNATDLYSRPGSSGSPAVNLDGEVVGVVSSQEEDVPQAAGMVTLEDMQEFFRGL